MRLPEWIPSKLSRTLKNAILSPRSKARLAWRWAAAREDGITAVVQGPLCEQTSDSIRHYLDLFTYVVISFWEGDNEQYIKEFVDHPKITLVRNKYSCLPLNTYTQVQNELKQAYTTRNGLMACKTKHSIKLRSDEYYNNFHNFFYLVMNSPDKIICNNIFFRTTHYSKFHISDHVIGGETLNLLGAFSILFDLFEQCDSAGSYIKPVVFGARPDEVYWRSPEVKWLSPEQLICMSFLNFMGEKPDSDNAAVIMRKYVDLVTVDEMAPFSARSNAIGYSMKNWEDVDWHRPGSILSMDEL